ncbi:hypothetical protein P885DRAFT_57332 [Corynascus similis CBS 632.67]
MRLERLPHPVRLTSFGGKDIADTETNERLRRAYLPIHPTRRHAEAVALLHLKKRRELRKKSYANTRQQHTIPFSILRPYNSENPNTRYALTAHSYRVLIDHAKFVLVSPAGPLPTPKSTNYYYLDDDNNKNHDSSLPATISHDSNRNQQQKQQPCTTNPIIRISQARPRAARENFATGNGGGSSGFTLSRIWRWIACLAALAALAGVLCVSGSLWWPTSGRTALFKMLLCRGGSGGSAFR